MNKEKYIAKTLYGLETAVAEELKNLGIIVLNQSNRAVEFEATLENLYRANIACRTVLKILKPIKFFRAKNPDQLYKKAREYGWSNLIKPNQSFMVESVVNSENFRHSKYAALKLKDAIVDKIRDKRGNRPNVDIKDPTFRINLHIENDNCTISLDSSGESLHRRGYRLSGEQAPLNEVLAAGMISLSGWDKKSNFIDPMCGSGTLAIEAALMALNIPPNLYREKFGFMNWNNFDREIFKKIKAQLISERRSFQYRIIANDLNTSSINSAKSNAKRAKVDSLIDFMTKDFFELENELDSGFIVTNPPYGERLRTEDINEFYKNIGDKLKSSYDGFDAWILSSNKEALKHFGLKTSRRLVLFNGALECKFHNYKMYRGSKKKKYE